ncbi:hypothetical protein Tco_0028416, partial [Tanacetum coccineum]
MNEESKDLEKKILKKRVVNEEDTAKVPAKQEATEQGTKKRKSDDEHRKCLRIVTFEGTIDSEIMETKSFIARLYKQYSEITSEDIELILWGDLKIMMESSTKENDQVKRRYPFSKELLQRMLDLGLEVEEESTATLQLGSQLTLLHGEELASPRSNSS